MKHIKLAAVVLIAAVFLFSAAACKDDRSGYMTGSCTKSGAAELLNESPELEVLGFTKKTCYNITPDGFGDIKLFKSSETGYTVVKYPDYSCAVLDASAAPGLISARLCDADNNGISDIIFTYVNGEKNEYGIGFFNNMTGYPEPVFQTDGDLGLYLVKQEAKEGMPDIFSVLAVTYTAFDGNCADIGCIALDSVGTVTFSDGRPVFNIEVKTRVNITEPRFTGVKKITVSSVPQSDSDKSYGEKEEIDNIVRELSSLKTDPEPADIPEIGGVIKIYALFYEDGSVAYVYRHNAGYIKLYGGDWHKITEE